MWTLGSVIQALTGQKFEAASFPTVDPRQTMGRDQFIGTVATAGLAALGLPKFTTGLRPTSAFETTGDLVTANQDVARNGLWMQVAEVHVRPGASISPGIWQNYVVTDRSDGGGQEICNFDAIAGLEPGPATVVMRYCPEADGRCEIAAVNDVPVRSQGWVA